MVKLGISRENRYTLKPKKMINSAIFDIHSKGFFQLKNIFALLLLVTPLFPAFSQYTETINSNRPGASQGAFAVGRQVVQGEAGFDFGKDSHSLRLYESNVYGANLALRYGLLWEQLELNANIRYQVSDINFVTGNTSNIFLSDLDLVQLGAKYLIYDPYKYGDDEPNLYSYHANHRFKWKSLIPAVSVYASAIFDFKVNPFREFLAIGPDAVIEKGVSPNVAIITQNNWGRWVWVNNFIGDRISTNFPSYIWITTMTHSFSPKISGFLEYQHIVSDLYSDYIGRFGGAYLVSKNWQVDLSALLNIKDTPSRWNVGVGISYRLDLHDKDEKLEIKDDKKGNAKKQSERINKKKKNKRKDALDSEGGGDDGGGN